LFFYDYSNLLIFHGSRSVKYKYFSSFCAFYWIRPTFSKCGFWCNFVVGYISYFVVLFIFYQNLVFECHLYQESLSCCLSAIFEWFDGLPHSGDRVFCFTQFSFWFWFVWFALSFHSSVDAPQITQAGYRQTLLGFLERIRSV